jgi:hypothetical protein
MLTWVCVEPDFYTCDGGRGRVRRPRDEPGERWWGSLRLRNGMTGRRDFATLEEAKAAVERWHEQAMKEEAVRRNEDVE